MLCGPHVEHAVFVLLAWFSLGEAEYSSHWCVCRVDFLSWPASTALATPASHESDTYRSVCFIPKVACSIGIRDERIQTVALSDLQQGRFPTTGRCAAFTSSSNCKSTAWITREISRCNVPTDNRPSWHDWACQADPLGPVPAFAVHSGSVRDNAEPWAAPAGCSQIKCEVRPSCKVVPLQQALMPVARRCLAPVMPSCGD